MTSTFFFYDLETFGLNPKEDRIAQFAGIRTDSDFNIIGDPINIYCQPPEDYIPDPESILITGITPEEAREKGLPEAQFAARIHEEFSQPNTCILGYNSIRFDDEMIRYLFYRNFIDPYTYSWQNGNSRWDLLDVVRATHAFRPEGIEWPIDDAGVVSLKLENLSKTNRLEHEKAHDALSDVYATIGMAKLIKTQQPRLFDYYFNHRRARD
ncbi:MAG TPA: exodeoxyribonuclease I, partial [Candidatus Ignatzschineria merdigallinarum]|nr:exodeoxyribonuclease I [Candidatus Ignatzschineria merdigallinarum]